MFVNNPKLYTSRHYRNLKEIYVALISFLEKELFTIGRWSVYANCLLNYSVVETFFAFDSFLWHNSFKFELKWLNPESRHDDDDDAGANASN